METEDLFIKIHWDGPFSLEAVSSLNNSADFGIYQVYGTHPVYGSSVLLYIGRAVGQTFAVRLPQERLWWNNPGTVEVYVGRLWGLKTPDAQTWNRHIELAERLLIYVHTPAENAQKELASWEPELQPVHVINWGRYRDLLPEVSGAAWTNRFSDVQNYRHFGLPPAQE